MDDMVLYLEMQNTRKDILLIIDSEYGIEVMKDIFTGICTEHLTILALTDELLKDTKKTLELISNEPKYHIPLEIELFHKKDFEKYKRGQRELAIIYEGVRDQKFLEKLCDLKVEYLIGMHDRRYINTFNVWESFRENTQKMYLISYISGGKKDVLNWEKNTENSIELSVIFPMYNIAKYLPQCIESVTAWKADYVEFLFVDDGSPDNCSDIVKEYAKNDGRIKLLKKKNGGCASARQYGLESAKGRYIGFIDPDDFIEPDMFRKLLTKALEGTYEIAYCGYQEYYENTGMSAEVSDVLGFPYNEGTSDPVKINELIGYQRVAIWRGIYSNDLIKRNKICFCTDLKRFDDLPFKIEVTSKARSVIAVPEYLYYYRMSRPGQDVSADDERLYVHFPIFEHLDAYMEKSSNRNQLDYLQLVKVHTHRYALEKIKKEFIAEYCKMCKKDIKRNFGFVEGLYIIKKLGAKIDAIWYIALYYGWKNIILKLRKETRQRDQKMKMTIKKLKYLNNKNI